jgi:hypothetical protein
MHVHFKINAIVMNLYHKPWCIFICTWPNFTNFNFYQTDSNLEKGSFLCHDSAKFLLTTSDLKLFFVWHKFIFSVFGDKNIIFGIKIQNWNDISRFILKHIFTYLIIVFLMEYVCIKIDGQIKDHLND